MDSVTLLKILDFFFDQIITVKISHKCDNWLEGNLQNFNLGFIYQFKVRPWSDEFCSVVCCIVAFVLWCYLNLVFTNGYCKFKKCECLMNDKLFHLVSNHFGLCKYLDFIIPLILEVNCAYFICFQLKF